MAIFKVEEAFVGVEEGQDIGINYDSNPNSSCYMGDFFNDGDRWLIFSTQTGHTVTVCSPLMQLGAEQVWEYCSTESDTGSSLSYDLYCSGGTIAKMTEEEVLAALREASE